MTRSLLRIAAFLGACSLLAAAEKQLKQGEYELYNQVLQDLRGADAAKSIADLNAWTQKFPDSDYGDERTAFYVQSYATANQPAKALDAAGELLAKGLPTAFPAPEGGVAIVRLLYNAVWAVSQAADLTQAQLDTGVKAARELLAYDHVPAGITPEKWEEARAEMKAKASAALLYVAMRPGIQAMTKQPPDCTAATAAYTRALGDYPNKAALSWELGRALSCEAKTVPEKQFAAIYEYLRAAEIDPTLGDARNDPKKIETFATNAYVRLHGSPDGLKELREQVKQSALPPAGFQIATATEIQEANQARFENENPQLALWMKIRATLSTPDGMSFFESQMKDAAVPRLSGVLMEAKPACRPKELTVGIAMPGSDSPLVAEIRLMLDKPLAGKPELKAELQWEGVPSAFTANPFLLTMNTESGKVEGLKLTPCAARKVN